MSESIKTKYLILFQSGYGHFKWTLFFVIMKLKYYLLLSHQLTRVLIHLGVMDPKTAKNGERFKYRDVTISELAAIFLYNEM